MTSRKLLPSDGVLIVGVSGGTDSLSLMHTLMKWHEFVTRPFSLHIATLDHGLRGEDGAVDARFVVETAQSWGLPVTAGQADVRTLSAKDGIGIEAAARIARYDFLASVARQVGATHIAVAHNADDQAETVLLHLLRGTGLPGLAGMRFSATLPGHADLMLIRPLLNVPRTDLEAYCREQGLQPRHDATNDDSTYTRNRLRHEIIPYLHEVTPQIRRNLNQLAEIAAEEDGFIDSALHTAVDSHIRYEEGRLFLPRDVFMNLPLALQRRFMVWAVGICGASSEVSFAHVKMAVDVAVHGQVGATALFGAGVRMRVHYDHSVKVEREDAPVSDDLPLLPNGDSVAVAIPGETHVEGHWSLQTSLTSYGIDHASLRLAIPEGASVMLRARREGERFAPIFLNGHTQKVSKWMINRQVPRHLRERLPLLVVDDEIAAIWWIDWDVGERFAVRDNAQSIVYFRFASDAN